MSSWSKFDQPRYPVELSARLANFDDETQIMLKIGDFSRICQVSIKALRHWDSIGLLIPAHTDQQSGYRYYTIEQLTQVNQILALKTMGLGLPQILELTRDNLSLEQIRAMLRLKQAELHQEMEQAAARLVMIESRLQQIEYEGNLPNYEAALKGVPAQKVLAIQEVIPTMQYLVEMLYETYAYARQKDTTNLMAIFHDQAYMEEGINVEVGFPVEEEYKRGLPLSPGRIMSVTKLPEVEQMACTVHHGPWTSLSNGYVFIGQWIENNGYEIAGPGREIFHTIDWQHDLKDTVTEIQFPVVRK